MKTTTFVYLATLLASSFIFCSCYINNKSQASDTAQESINVKVSNFKEIKVSGSLNVEYTQIKGSKQKVQISGPQKLIERVEVYENSEVLHIKFNNNRNSFYENIDNLKVFVSSPELRAVSLLGSGDIDMKGNINTEIMKIALIGSGNINTGGFTCKGEFKAILKGSGDINLDGQIEASEMELELLGSGDIDARNISVNNGEISLSGSGGLSIKNIKATSINASLRGSGDLQMEGICNDASLSLASSGNLNARNLKTPNVTANIAGSGDLSCHATKTLKYSAYGSGTIYYNGEPIISSKDNRHKHLKKL